jgi:hypothetical protein
MRFSRWAVFSLAVAMLAGSLVQAGRKDEPDQVTVQHILIGYKRTVPNKKLDRTKAEAKALAEELTNRARTLEDPAEFTALVEEYTDDSAPGIYILINDGAPAARGTRKRRDMVAAFGDVAFELEVGEAGLAKYHAGNSPYGWHVILRLE